MTGVTAPSGLRTALRVAVRPLIGRARLARGFATAAPRAASPGRRGPEMGAVRQAACYGAADSPNQGAAPMTRSSAAVTCTGPRSPEGSSGESGL